MFQFTSGLPQEANRKLVDTFSRFPSLPPPEHHYFIFIVPKSLQEFSCPHLDHLFLDHVPYVAKVDDIEFSGENNRSINEVMITDVQTEQVTENNTTKFGVHLNSFVKVLQ